MAAEAELHGARHRVDRHDLEVPAPEAAAALLGCLLECRPSTGDSAVIVRIVEVEAYGPADPASHSVRGRTPRNSSMFGPPGMAYVYRSYGIHWCLNVSVDALDVGAAVLLRAAVVVAGEQQVRARRQHVAASRDLLRGPGNLARALGIEAARHDGIDLLTSGAHLTLTQDGYRPTAATIRWGPRTGVSRAADIPWRLWITDSPAVSRYRRSPRVVGE